MEPGGAIHYASINAEDINKKARHEAATNAVDPGKTVPPSLNAEDIGKKARHEAATNAIDPGKKNNRRSSINAVDPGKGGSASKGY